MSLCSYENASKADEPTFCANAFIDSIGINANPFAKPITYDSGQRRPAYTPGDLFSLGIKHYRCVLKNDQTSDSQVDLVANAYRKYGAQVMFLLDPRKTGSPDDMTRLLESYPAGAIDIVEGPNEVNNKFPPQELNLRYDNNVDEAAGAAFCRDYYGALTADPKLSAIQFASFTAIFTDYRDAKPFDEFDLANMHSYQGVGVPESSLIPNIRDIYNIYPAGGTLKPIIASECGYAVADGSHKSGRVSERVQARELPVLLCEYFRHGIKRAYLFGMDDDDGYGLMDFAGNKRPAYFGLKSFIAAVSPDPVNDIPEGGWTKDRIAESGLGFIVANAPSTVHSVCLNEGGGNYDILIWNELQQFDSRLSMDIRNPTVNVKINFSTVINSHAAVSTQSDDGSSFQMKPILISDSSLILSVSDSVTILRVKTPYTPTTKFKPKSVSLVAIPDSRNPSISVKLNWPKSSEGNARGYYLFRNGEFIHRFDVSVVSFIDSDQLVLPGLTYSYSLYTYSSSGDILCKTHAQVTTAPLFPNLQPSTISISPYNPKPGDAVQFSALVGNTGGPTPNFTPVTATFSIDDKVVSWGAITRLNSGQSLPIVADGGPQTTKFWIATPGSHTLSVSVDDLDAIPSESDKYDNLLDTTIFVGQTAPPGELVGTAEAAIGLVDLTTTGDRDWMHFGDKNSTQFEHKAHGSGILGFSHLGDGFWDIQPGVPIGVAWRDAALPSLASQNTHSGLWTNGIGSGFQVDFAAGTTEQVARVWAAGLNGGGELRAHLTDNSAPDYVSDTFDGNGNETWSGPRPVEFTIRYRAATVNQRLIVTWTLHHEQDRFLGQAQIIAAALSSPKN